MSNSTGPTLTTLFGRSGVEPVDPSLVSGWVSGTTTEKSFQVAVVTVLVYDALITLDKEAKYFWKIPKAVVDYVFFVNRYFSILGAISFIPWFSDRADLALCNFTGWMRNTANWVTIVSIDYILMIRVLALYSRDKRLTVCLGVLLVLGATFKLSMAVYLNIAQQTAVGSIGEEITICGTDFIPPWRLGVLDWLVPMAYGTLLMILAIHKAAEYWRISAGFKGFMLVKILIRDQALYFMLVVACCLFAILGYKLEISDLILGSLLNTFGNPALLSILGSRMLFNLKEAAELGVNEGTNLRVQSETLSAIDFAEPEHPQRRNVTGSDEDALEA